MRTRGARLAGAVAVVVSVGLVGATAGAGSAGAAEPIVVGNCRTSVQGEPGQPVSLATSAVLQPVSDLVRAVPLLGPPLAEPFGRAFAALPPIPVGSVPTGTGHVHGADIANAVVAKLREMPLLGPVVGALATSVQQTLSAGCGITVTAVGSAVAPVQDGARDLADTSQSIAAQALPGLARPPAGQPGPQPETRPGTAPGTRPGVGTGEQPTGGANQVGGTAQGGFTPVGGLGPASFGLYPVGRISSGNFGRVAMFSYGSLPFAAPGGYAPSPGVRYGGQVPGYSPGYDVLGADDADGVQTAGRAQALPRLGGSAGGVGAPLLLAVLALSCVTGALVRTWALRRAGVRPA
ncbi:hypothetical protein [Umezawaea beigongshangensis]|uniref:hypothetical protein n=1 Tax=Umezawaea beigongshangensis TaxID=2780383 RepID=UPI0018F1DBC6|nr:hypothetical protein [Umezawaea beigongshangensis]